MAEFTPDSKLLYLTRGFVDRARELGLRTDGTQILATFAQYMLHYRPGFTVVPPLANISRIYDGSTSLLTITDASGVRNIPYLESNSVLFEDLISKPENLRSSDDLLVLVRARSYKQGLAKIRSMRYRVRKTIGDIAYPDGTWDWVQTVNNGTILMKRDKFLASDYFIG